MSLIASAKPEPLSAPPSILGEGPLVTQTDVWWIDMVGCSLHRISVSKDKYQHALQHDTPIKFVLETEEGEILLGLDQAIHRYAHGSLEVCPIIDVILDQPSLTLNDAAVAPDGSIWVGVHEKDHRVAGGCIVRIVNGEKAVVADALTLPNGIGFSPDGSAAYFVDSLAHGIFAVDLDSAGGPTSSPRPLWRDREFGLPDGLSVDNEGHIWVAFWGGARVMRISPAGEPTGTINFPVRQVTNCAFGANSTMYVTTANYNNEGPVENLAGRVFIVDAGVEGTPHNRARIN